MSTPICNHIPNKNFQFHLNHTTYDRVLPENIWFNILRVTNPFKNVYGLLCMMKHKFKSPPKIKKWSFGFYCLVLVFYNNINYKYESFLTHLFTNWT